MPVVIYIYIFAIQFLVEIYENGDDVKFSGLGTNVKFNVGFGCLSLLSKSLKTRNEEAITVNDGWHKNSSRGCLLLILVYTNYNYRQS